MLPGNDINSVNDYEHHTIYTGSIREVIHQRLEEVIPKLELGYDEAFVVGDLGDLHRQHMKWKTLLPRIEPFYAIKCNPDPMVVKYLASLGVGYDCASRSEIQQVLDAGVDPSRIIYAHPCKQPSFVRYAADNNVSLMTFDSTEELHKIKRIYPNAQLVLRMLTDDSKSQIRVGLKFGAPLDTIKTLLITAKELELNVIGVSFHVGSGCSDVRAFADAVDLARNVFDQAASIGFQMKLLDCGGGMPGRNIQHGITFEDVAATLGEAVDRLFPPNVRVIAEPGRFYVSSAFTVCSHIIGRRVLLPDDSERKQYMYYLNDGMHGSFMLRLLDRDDLNLRVIMRNGTHVYDNENEKDENRFISSVWGPTCDPKDCLLKDVRLPLLGVGDWICQENMGAYACAATGFNGFEKPKTIYTNSFIRSSL
ncbi:ornithine decarboxylase [Zychaea mexicana]|uniref:ornithine decarboxylase n=1 Tax=Zychaea mexicana TaxID=64656 RepID=UPI0022FEBF0A|nr:ornithine decarboxylase [Zychaea mexicana]KAI9498704.1 ornithine decarboxylase [Zychaea mexicana]